MDCCVREALEPVYNLPHCLLPSVLVIATLQVVAPSRAQLPEGGNPS